MQGQRLSNSAQSSLTLDQQLGSHASSSQQKFTSSAFVLSILENFISSGDGEKTNLPPVFQKLEKSIGEKRLSLKTSILNIDSKERQALQEKVGPAIFEALLSISQETDLQLFAEGLLNIGRSLKKALDEAKAGLIFQMLGQDAIPIKAREAAKAEYDAMVGQGSTGMRVEHLANRFFKDAADYKTIVPMLGSTALFSVVRTAAAAKLATSGLDFISRGLGLKIASAFFGSAVEIPTFALSGRALHKIFGDQVRESVSEDLLSAGITLTFLKGFGFAGNKAYAQLHQLNELGLSTRLAGLSKFTQPLLSQSFMFAGLLTAHKAEEKVGRRAHVDNATTITDTLASMVSLGVGGHLGNRVLGSGYAKFQQEMEFRMGNAEFGVRNENGDFPHLGMPALAAVDGLGTGLGAYFSKDFASPREARPELRLDRVFQQADADSPPSNRFSAYELRHYQGDMLKGFGLDLDFQVSPWLGIASPMQTGKSYLIGPMIRMLRSSYGLKARVIILSSARIITDQILNDLLAGFPEQEVGRFDRERKEIRPITVASTRSLVNHLEEFDHDGPTILINDEAYTTQSRSHRAIYTHFGLGEIVGRGKNSVMQLKAGNGLVVGLSGTGAGLEGYHLSEHYNLLDAIEEGWVRKMHGERVPMTIPATEKRSALESQMIWWNPTEENARALANLYDQKIHGRFRKNLVYVPTTKHAQVLRDALRERHGKNYAHTVHSKMEQTGQQGTIETDMKKVIEHWEENGGALISVRMLGRGFRGTGVDSVFHTYQTSSVELLFQRTGRAWGQSADHPFPELFVLEASWNPRGPYANLPCALGLVDYPSKGFSTHGLRKKIESSRQRKKDREELEQKISIGQAEPLFTKIPLAEEWRKGFGDILLNVGGMGPLQTKTGFKTELLVGYGLGALPTRWVDMERFSKVLGSKEAAEGLWVRSWESATEELLEGIQGSEDRFVKVLTEWRQKEAELPEQAKDLDALLQQYFHPKSRGLNKSDKKDPIRALIQDLPGQVKELFSKMSDEERRKFFEIQLRTAFSPVDAKIIESRYLTDTPKNLSEIGRDIGVSPSRVGQINHRIMRGIIKHLSFLNNLAEDPDKIPVANLPLSKPTRVHLIHSDIRTLGDLRIADIESIENIGTVTEIKEFLVYMGFLWPPAAAQIELGRKEDPILSIVQALRQKADEEGLTKFIPDMSEETLRAHIENGLKNTSEGLLPENVQAIAMRYFYDPPMTNEEIAKELDGTKRWVTAVIAHANERVTDDFLFPYQSRHRFKVKELIHVPVGRLLVSLKLEDFLKKAHVHNFGDLTRLSYVDYSQVKQMGQETEGELEQILTKNGLSLSLLGKPSRGQAFLRMALNTALGTSANEALKKYISEMTDRELTAFFAIKIGGLVPLPRKIMLLRFFSDPPLSYSEIADYLRIPKDRVGYHIHEAFEFILSRLDAKLVSQQALNLKPKPSGEVRPASESQEPSKMSFQHYRDIFDLAVSKTHFSQKTVKSLKRLNIRFIGLLVQFNESTLEILLGKAATLEIKEVLAGLKLDLDSAVKVAEVGWIPPIRIIK
jgi:superfamily II DNA or RNA helicase/DNA-directed RNA polymerase alpha subunit